MKHISPQNDFKLKLDSVKHAYTSLVICPNTYHLEQLATRVIDAMACAISFDQRDSSLRRARYAISTIAGDAVFAYIMNNPHVFWKWSQSQRATDHSSWVPWMITLRVRMTGI